MARFLGYVWTVLGMIVVIFLLGVVAWAFRPISTGQAISEENEVRNYVSSPFTLRAWVVNHEGIRVDLANIENEELVVYSVEVSGCGKTQQGKAIAAGRSELFFIPCQLSQGTNFQGVMIVDYETSAGTRERALGNIDDVV